MAGIPVRVAGEPTAGRVWWWPRRGQWVGAAAAAIILVSFTIWIGMPWGRQLPSGIDANGSSGRVYATDHNSLRPSDTNVCDINGIR